MRRVLDVDGSQLLFMPNVGAILLELQDWRSQIFSTVLDEVLVVPIKVAIQSTKPPKAKGKDFSSR